MASEFNTPVLEVELSAKEEHYFDLIIRTVRTTSLEALYACIPPSPNYPRTAFVLLRDLFEAAYPSKGLAHLNRDAALIKLWDLFGDEEREVFLMMEVYENYWYTTAFGTATLDYDYVDSGSSGKEAIGHLPDDSDHDPFRGADYSQSQAPSTLSWSVSWFPPSLPPRIRRKKLLRGSSHWNFDWKLYQKIPLSTGYSSLSGALKEI